MLRGYNDYHARKLKDLNSFTCSRPIYNYLDLHGIKVDQYLDLFIWVMKYIYPFFPAEDLKNQERCWRFVPFIIDAVYHPEQLRDLCAQTAQAWPEVYKTHPSWANKNDEAKLTLVIRGNVNFFTCLARHCWPLGKLANSDAFINHPENLQIFCREISRLAGEHILFLYGGTSCVSDIGQVTGTLRSSLLRHSPAFRDGEFSLTIYDEELGDNLSQHFIHNPDEQKFLNDVSNYERDGGAEWRLSQQSEVTIGAPSDDYGDEEEGEDE